MEAQKMHTGTFALKETPLLFALPCPRHAIYAQELPLDYGEFYCLSVNISRHHRKTLRLINAMCGEKFLPASAWNS
ncbi:hypothetical protein SH582_12870 [Raoultella ornithinolytica]|uniref:hypothetical protein n=1 Tax=Raoultella ornithinolytica TaxID=54291 RepID=UPI002A5A8CAC|nr:hypothetical protein [Raoultella ornithinolytica]WPO26722.1 hypothetical protein SH582_12870 [Raoultella ornithinolytica]